MGKIWVILTWWTPACDNTEAWRIPWNQEAFTHKLLTILEWRAGVDMIPVFNIDSSDFRWTEHEDLAKCILKESSKDHIGYVVIHGTDTNAYTLASHSYMIKWLPVPVVHTWSVIPLQQIGSDFPSNFAWAVDAVLESELLWTYQFFWDSLSPWVHVTKQKTNSLKPFITPRINHSFGFMDSKRKFHVDQKFKEIMNQAHKETSTVLDIDIKLEKDIESIKMTPFTDFAIFDFFREQWKKWILIEGFWDANVPTSEEFQEAIRRCIDSWMIILLWTQCLFWERTANYEWWKKLIDMWAILMKNHTNEAAIGKLAWVLEKYKWNLEKVRSTIERDVNGDSIQL